MKIEKLVGDKLVHSAEEVRESSDKYEELVLLSRDMTQWNKVLTEKLGPPLKSTKEMAHRDFSEGIPLQKRDAAMNRVNALGGVRHGQTIYFGSCDSCVILIMLWPWQDQTRITLKKVIV
ncbi:MAG: hypothetical protein KKH94_13050 [Candidatus Omnitrophica bacterium]|nr:hypothetical protein [Candidatus Omnitrophota bacterium]